MIFSKIQVQFWIGIRMHNLELRIRILQKVSNPYGSGSTTLATVKVIFNEPPQLSLAKGRLQFSSRKGKPAAYHYMFYQFYFPIAVLRVRMRDSVII
jgi:hypothetical protein